MFIGVLRFFRLLSTLLGLLAAGLIIYVLLTDSSYFSSYLEPVRSQVLKGDGFFTVPLHSRRTATYVTATLGDTNNASLAQNSVHFLIDSGSDHFWVRDHLITQSDARLSPNRFAVEYAGGNASGVQGEATFFLGSLNWTQRVGVVDSVSPQLKEVHSVVGVSRKCRDPKLCVLPHWQLKESVLSFVYDIGKEDGRFLAGHLDESLCKQSMKWLPVADSFYWNTEAQMFVANERLGDEKLRAVWDTGTSFLYLSSKLYERVTRKVPTKNEPCNLRSLPTIELEFQGQRFQLPGNIYASLNLDKTCSYQLGLLDSRWVATIGAEILIGWVFIQAHYVALHVDKDAVGICAHQDLSSSSFRAFRVRHS